MLRLSICLSLCLSRKKNRPSSQRWELLHDEQGFLVLRTRQPVSLIHRLSQQELATLSTAFESPLRILLVTARPEGTSFIDPRSAACPLFDEMQEQMEEGSVTIEVLRPPTLQALRDRLKSICLLTRTKLRKCRVAWPVSMVINILEV